ncbi:uncharacterized protein C8Q71DRAFT_491288 [Rhodofomes roseus]|uniref:Uncharacterized protein n=1 Tax=Rhodofomes roseus TaxID=34475 RepID=A0ABQ8KL52_9APHY|nr:uncharacterized protein C8Q71DRAFT_491288 [Rhodofomes roseus]KAH9839042.1 hypothetical protein C8Q71DRAFT_491288 [Rhodofomes roseus]
MRFSAILAVVALSTTALPVMSRPMSYVYARDYDNLLARAPAGELEDLIVRAIENGDLQERGLFGIVTHSIKAAATGIKSLVRRSNRSTKRILTSSISSNASTTSMSTISLEMNRVFNCLFTRDAGPTSALTTSRENVALLASNLQHMQFVYGSHMTKEHAGALRILVIIQATHARAFRSSSEKPHRCKS